MKNEILSGMGITTLSERKNQIVDVISTDGKRLGLEK